MVAEILETLRKTGKTVATAESITAGHLQARLASVSGSSDVFKGGITAYHPSVKIEHLGVNEALAEKTDCVDENIARQMAMGALKLFHSDYALATCGYAERASGSPYAFYAIAGVKNGLVFSERIELNGSRIEVQQAVAKMVLEKLLELLRNKTGDQ